MAAQVRLYKIQTFTGTPDATGAKVNIQRIVVVGTAAPAAVIARAGNDQTGLEPWSICTLDGSTSSVSNGPATYLWTQTAGPTVTIDSPDENTTTFEVPGALDDATLTFSLLVTDNVGGTASDLVSIGILPVTDTIVIGGAEQPIHWMTV